MDNVKERISKLIGRQPVAEQVADEKTNFSQLKQRRQEGGVVLDDHAQIVENGLLLPYIGETPVLPDKVNPAIPDDIWASLQHSGALAATHLNLILSDRKFPRLAMKDQRALIELALSRAYGSVDGSVRKNLHVFVNPEDAKGFNALADMSKKAHRQLPEFVRANAPVSPIEGELADEDSND